MKRLLLALAIALIACPAVIASEEDYAGWKSVTFTCQPMQPFPETTVTVESEGDAADLRLRLLRVANSQFDLTVPKEAIEDLKHPMLDTVRLSTEAGRGGAPWMYVTFKLGNPRAGEPWDFPTVYIKIRDGKVVGRSLKRTSGNRIGYEDLPYATR